MSWLPKSKKARRRLLVVAMAAPVLVLAAVLAILALKEAGYFIYTPLQAQEAHVPAGRHIQLAGLVEKGSVMRHTDGSMMFTVTDNVRTAPVTYHGEVPDLFVEGKGVVAKGAFDANGEFHATQILAKHDENYMPRELTKALKETGEWRGKGAAAPSYGAAPQ